MKIFTKGEALQRPLRVSLPRYLSVPRVSGQYLTQPLEDGPRSVLHGLSGKAQTHPRRRVSELK
jgi:hypothetical protein